MSKSSPQVNAGSGNRNELNKQLLNYLASRAGCINSSSSCGSGSSSISSSASSNSSRAAGRIPAEICDLPDSICDKIDELVEDGKELEWSHIVDIDMLMRNGARGEVSDSLVGKCDDRYILPGADVGNESGIGSDSDSGNIQLEKFTGVTSFMGLQPLEDCVTSFLNRDVTSAQRSDVSHSLHGNFESVSDPRSTPTPSNIDFSIASLIIPPPPPMTSLPSLPPCVISAANPAYGESEEDDTDDFESGFILPPPDEFLSSTPPPSVGDTYKVCLTPCHEGMTASSENKCRPVGKLNSSHFRFTLEKHISDHGSEDETDSRYGHQYNNFDDSSLPGLEEETDDFEDEDTLLKSRLGGETGVNSSCEDSSSTVKPSTESQCQFQKSTSNLNNLDGTWTVTESTDFRVPNTGTSSSTGKSAVDAIINSRIRIVAEDMDTDRLKPMSRPFSDMFGSDVKRLYSSELNLSSGYSPNRMGVNISKKLTSLYASDNLADTKFININNTNFSTPKEQDLPSDMPSGEGVFGFATVRGDRRGQVQYNFEKFKSQSMLSLNNTYSEKSQTLPTRGLNPLKNKKFYQEMSQNSYEPITAYRTPDQTSKMDILRSKLPFPKAQWLSKNSADPRLCVSESGTPEDECEVQRSDYFKTSSSSSSTSSSLSSKDDRNIGKANGRHSQSRFSASMEIMPTVFEAATVDRDVEVTTSASTSFNTFLGDIKPIQWNDEDSHLIRKKKIELPSNQRVKSVGDVVGTSKSHSGWTSNRSVSLTDESPKFRKPLGISVPVPVPDVSVGPAVSHKPTVPSKPLKCFSETYFGRNSRTEPLKSSVNIDSGGDSVRRSSISSATSSISSASSSCASSRSATKSVDDSIISGCSANRNGNNGSTNVAVTEKKFTILNRASASCSNLAPSEEHETSTSFMSHKYQARHCIKPVSIFSSHQQVASNTQRSNASGDKTSVEAAFEDIEKLLKRLSEVRKEVTESGHCYGSGLTYGSVSYESNRKKKEVLSASSRRLVTDCKAIVRGAIISYDDFNCTLLPAVGTITQVIDSCREMTTTTCGLDLRSVVSLVDSVTSICEQFKAICLAAVKLFQGGSSDCLVSNLTHESNNHDRAIESLMGEAKRMAQLLASHMSFVKSIELVESNEVEMVSERL